MRNRKQGEQSKKSRERHHRNGNVSAEFGNDMLITRYAGRVARQTGLFSEIVEKIMINGNKRSDAKRWAEHSASLFDLYPKEPPRTSKPRET